MLKNFHTPTKREDMFSYPSADIGKVSCSTGIFSAQMWVIVYDCSLAGGLQNNLSSIGVELGKDQFKAVEMR